MFQEDPRRPFTADIPDEIRDRASAAPEMDSVGAHFAPRTAIRELGMLTFGAGLVIGAVVLGVIAGVVIAGAVIVLFGRTLVGGDRA